MARDTGTSDSPGLSLRDPGHLVALGLGTGLLPLAPGTWGSLLAIPLFLVLQPFGTWLYLLAVAGLLAVGVYVSGRAARALGVHDHGAIVVDEVVGMLVVWIAVEPGWFAIAAGFVLFRLFDIFKPWPIRPIDRGVKGGLGIMLDDLAAGLMAAVVLQGLLYVAPAALVGA